MIIQIGSVINDDLAAFKQETIDIYSNVSTSSNVPVFHDPSFFFSRVSDNKNSRRDSSLYTQLKKVILFHE